MRTLNGGSPPSIPGEIIFTSVFSKNAHFFLCRSLFSPISTSSSRPLLILSFQLLVYLSASFFPWLSPCIFPLCSSIPLLCFSLLDLRPAVKNKWLQFYDFTRRKVRVDGREGMDELKTEVEEDMGGGGRAGRERKKREKRINSGRWKKGRGQVRKWGKTVEGWTKWRRKGGRGEEWGRKQTIVGLRKVNGEDGGRHCSKFPEKE